MNKSQMKYSNSTSSLPTSYFSDKVLVICPKCDGPGTMTSKFGKNIIPKPYHFTSTFICNSCKYSTILDTMNKYGIIGTYQGFGEKNCSNCENLIVVITEPSKQPYRDTEVKCNSCHKINIVALHWGEYRDHRAIDPFLGFELLLKTSIKNDVLWFYNFDHLDFIRDYINSKIRDDNNRQKYSLISNLPKFILAAKNREILNDKMCKLEDQFRRKDKTHPTT